MGHWYSKQGEPCHFQPDGKDTTLRHARKDGLLPSVTTILDLMDKPGLNRWMVNQHLKAAFENPPGKLEHQGEWESRIRTLANESTNVARQRGDEIHNALESYFNGDMQKKDAQIVECVVEHMDDLGLPCYGWVAEKTIACRVGNYGFGGAIDLHHPDEQIIVDFKTKDLAESKGKLAYPNHARQLAAYAYALWERVDVQAVNLFVGRDIVDCRSHIWDADTMREEFQVFKRLLEIWHRERRYMPYG